MTYRLMRWLVRFIARTYLAGGLLEVDGVENVPRSGALLVCGNHTSTVDPPLLPAFLPRVDSWSMGKKEYFDNWFVNWLFRRYHAFPVVRHTADRAALRRATEILRAGKVLVLYPEGTRITQGGLHRPEPGAGFLAKLTGAPILPVGLIGTREAFPKGSWLPRRHRVEIRFGKPFKLRTEPRGRSENQALADAIMLKVAELLPPELRGVFSDLEGWRQRVGSLIEPEDDSAR